METSWFTGNNGTRLGHQAYARPYYDPKHRQHNQPNEKVELATRCAGHDISLLMAGSGIFTFRYEDVDFRPPETVIYHILVPVAARSAGRAVSATCTASRGAAGREP